MTRHIDAGGAALVKQFESCRLEAYRDAAGVWTIGYGSTRGVRAGMTITQAEAEQRFADDLAPAEKAVAELVTVPLVDNQFAALVSFVFNCGAGTLRTSTLLKKLNAGDYGAVPGEMKRFVYAGGKYLPGLARRREAEGALWLRAEAPPPPAAVPGDPSANPAPTHKPATPAAAAPASHPAATTTGSTLMNPISILTELFGGVVGKLNTAATVASVAPKVVSGTISSIGEIPAVVKDIETLISEVKGGKWADVPDAFEAILAEFGKILGNYGVSLPGLTGMVDKMTPAAVTAGKTVA